MNRTLASTLLLSLALHVLVLLRLPLAADPPLPPAGPSPVVALQLAPTRRPSPEPAPPQALADGPTASRARHAEPPPPKPAPAARSAPPSPPARRPMRRKPPVPRPALAAGEKATNTAPPTSAPGTEAKTSMRHVPLVQEDARMLRQDYLAALVAAIERHRHYPRMSRRRGEEGRVVMHFVLRADGTLEDIRVIASSGYRRLDEAARATLASISPFRPIPPGLGLRQWEIEVPIQFRLR